MIKALKKQTKNQTPKKQRKVNNKTSEIKLRTVLQNNRDNKIKSWTFKNINKNDEPLARLAKNLKRKYEFQVL